MYNDALDVENSSNGVTSKYTSPFYNISRPLECGIFIEGGPCRSAVIEALYYKPEGRGFETPMG
jgi:hypothetical protein